MSPSRLRMPRGAFIHATGQHIAAWRHPAAHTGADTCFAEMVEGAPLAECSKRQNPSQAL